MVEMADAVADGAVPGAGEPSPPGGAAGLDARDIISQSEVAPLRQQKVGLGLAVEAAVAVIGHDEDRSIMLLGEGSELAQNLVEPPETLDREISAHGIGVRRPRIEIGPGLVLE